MREMVLNHASVEAFDSGSKEASECLLDIASGMGQLVDCGTVGKVLWAAGSSHSILCQSGDTLCDVWLSLRRQHRDAYCFFGGLLNKSKFLDPEKLTPYEERTLPGGKGQPLIFTAIEDGVLIGFPSASRWDCDQTVVEFGELLPDGTLDEREEEVDQLTRSSHADSICDRHRLRVAQGMDNDPSRLWENRQDVFPHIQFGLDVEQHLKREANHLPQIIKKLNDLNQSGKEWAGAGGNEPPWKTKVTPESDRVRSNRGLWNQRYFRASSGTRELFEWHARFGSSGRIHLRFNTATRTIEVGYIGPHLPL